MTQQTLQTREADQVDNISVPSWYTHPDEMLDLLRSAPEFTVSSDKIWRLGSYATSDELLADVVLALQRGMPSIINISESDHWVVVVGAGLDALGRLQFLQMRDPLPTDMRSHTYVDGCSDRANGESYGDPWELTRSDLAGYHLEIGNVPPPYGMGNYAGRYVGIIHGPAVSAEALHAFGKKLRPPRQPPSAPEAPVLDPASLILELRRRAGEWGIEQLDALLDLNPDPAVRLVKDIDGSSSEYTLLSLFSKDERYGAVAAFEPTGSLKHFRFTKDQDIDASLRSSPEATLWWSRRFLPALQSPYFPFLRKVELHQLVYTRLLDGFPINTALPDA